MKHLLASLVLVVGIIVSAQAQTPKYYVTSYPSSAGASFVFGQLGTLPDTTLTYKLQSIYFPTDFPGAPSGSMTYVYLRIGQIGFQNTPTIYHDLTVKIGYTTKTRFANDGVRDSFATGLTKIFNAATFTVQGADTIGKWIKMPVNQGNFIYNKESNFVVEVIQGLPLPQNPIKLMASKVAPYRTHSGEKDSATTIVTQAFTMDFGFDLYTTGVENTSSLSDLSVYPNPSNGKCAIFFNAARAVQEVSILVRSVTGTEVMQQHYHNGGTQFYKDIDLSAAAKGMYFISVDADGERKTNRIVIE